eukprot:TRINITY_DN3220_c1_g1_i1.p1 TRINITY_DN3220_c1_g1~~TRINITY_DN3220_c1_g1_i1.p1  ORF type:complete len:161 (-),score=26.16 TRINITY_DN3220_c1_g1_i1:262-744(-)
MKLYFHITGFGKFCGVNENPTEILIERLPTYLQENSIPENIQVLSYSILDVAGIDAVFFFGSTISKFHNQIFEPNTRTIWLHFGVWTSLPGFNIETTGWNEADFSCPDEREWQPIEQKIVTNSAQSLKTDLPVTEIHASLSQKYNVALSTDPGRFLCNFI